MRSRLPNSTMLRFFLACVVGLVGASLFTFIHMPIPWLLGPMVAVLIGNKLGGLQLAWPGYVRNIGVLIVGYSLGLSLTGKALVEIVNQLPSMLLMTVTLVTFCVLIGVVISRISGINFPTLMLACIPGGISQMITLAEEFHEVDVTVVTFFQVTRLMMIAFFVPLLLFSPLLGGEHLAAAAGAVQPLQVTWGALFQEFGVYLPVCALSAWVGNKINLPTAYMLGPMIGTAVLQISGFHGSPLPSSLINLSQFMIGGYMGLQLQPGRLKRKFQTISFAFISGAMMIMGSLGLSLILNLKDYISISTGFLSLAPGGMDQMGIMAHEISADLSMVSGYQTFRLLFIFFVVSIVLKVLLRYMAKRRISPMSPQEINDSSLNKGIDSVAGK
jgi:membrane AbrB-like protein